VKNSNGFMLIETLVVTLFVSGVLIYLFIQFNNLDKNYEDSFSYNTIEGLYALNNVKEYILNDSKILLSLQDVETSGYINLKNCDNVTDREYCEELLKLINVNKIYIAKNHFDEELFINTDNDFKKFLSKISSQGIEKYRLLAEFNDSTYATIRFGD